MNGAGEADLLEIVRSEVRLLCLEPFVMAPLNDLSTHILNCTTFVRGAQVVWVVAVRKGTLPLVLAIALGVMSFVNIT